jgi:hypothetical protein
LAQVDAQEMAGTGDFGAAQRLTPSAMDFASRQTSGARANKACVIRVFGDGASTL